MHLREELETGTALISCLIILTKVRPCDSEEGGSGYYIFSQFVGVLYISILMDGQIDINSEYSNSFVAYLYCKYPFQIYIQFPFSLIVCFVEQKLILIKLIFQICFRLVPFACCFLEHFGAFQTKVMKIVSYAYFSFLPFKFIATFNMKLFFHCVLQETSKFLFHKDNQMFQYYLLKGYSFLYCVSMETLS